MKSLTNNTQTALSEINQNNPIKEKDEIQDIQDELQSGIEISKEEEKDEEIDELRDIIDALLSGKVIPKNTTQDIDDDIDWELVELNQNYYDSLEDENEEKESLEWALQQEF